MKKHLSCCLASLLLFQFTFSQNDHAGFTWEMGQRLDEAYRYYNRQTASYNPRMLNEADGWIVRFDARSITVPYAPATYTWLIEGLGDLSFYKKTYTSDLPRLSAERLLNPDNTTARMIAPGLSTNHPDSIEPQHPNPSSLLGDRLPRIGSYRITLTINRQNPQKKDTPFVYKETIKLKNIIIACIGDSFNSGEGNPDDATYHSSIPCSTNAYNTALSLLSAGLDLFLGKEIPYYTQVKNYLDNKNITSVPTVSSPNIWYEPRAHRSLLSGPARAARYIEDLDPQSAVTFIDFATSGAMIEKGLIKAQYSWQPEGQLDQLKHVMGEKKIDFLLMSIGINDVALTEILADAIKTDFTRTKVAAVKRLIDDLRVRYDGLKAFLADRLKVDKTILTTYPAPIFTITGFAGTTRVEKPSRFPFHNGTGHEITDAEAPNLDEVGQYLNGIIRLAAQKNGWLLSDPSDAFLGHGYSSESPYELNARSVPSYYVRLNESCKNQGDYRGMVHPNVLGHEAYATVLSAVMQRFVKPPIPELAPRPRTVRITITSIKRLQHNSYRGIGERFNTPLNYPIPVPPDYDQFGVRIHTEFNSLRKDTVIAYLSSTLALNGFSFDLTVSAHNSHVNMYLTFNDRSPQANLLGIYYEELYPWLQSDGGIYTKTGRSIIPYPTYEDGTETDIELFEISYKFELIKDDNPITR